MDVLRFGSIYRTEEGVLKVTGFTFTGGENSQANDPNYVIPAVIRSLCVTFPGSVSCETFNQSSEEIVMRATQKAREA